MRRPARSSAASLIVIGLAAAFIAGLLVFGGLSSRPAADTAAALTSAAPTATAPEATTTVAPTTSPASQPPSLPPPDASANPSIVPQPTPLTPTARNARLQRYLDAFVKTEAVPGMSVTIDFADGTSWTGVSGLADVATRRKVAAGTTFAVGSISKTFLAALVLELADKGKLRLDDRVVRYLPDLRLDRRITVRQLLDHTSGLFDYFLNTKIDAALRRAPTRTWTAKEALAYMRTAYFPPGRGWHYSNANYVVLGLLAEKVGGESLAAQYRARFFNPLDLTETFYQIDEPPRGELAHGYRFAEASKKSRPIDLADGTGVAPFTSVVSAAGGAGSIASTSADIARWAKALYGGEVLSPASLALMIGDVGRTATYKPRIPYGLGVQAVPVNGLPTLGHSGRLLGFRGVVRYFPEQAVSIAIVSNQSRTDPARLLARLARIVIPTTPPTCAGCSASP